MKLSKSKYVLGTRCEKLLWLSCYKKDEQEESNDVVLESGNKVGELARHLFGEYVLIEYNDNHKLMIDETKKHLKEKPNIICEASFNYNDNFCSIDILKNDIDGVEIYEVKSSTKINTSYINDISYQTWVLKKCGLNVKKSYLVYVNDQYVFHKKLKMNEYFKIEDVTNILNLDEIEEKTLELKKIINSKNEPNVRITRNCKKNKDNSYNCPFFKYCTSSLPTSNIFDLGWKMKFEEKLKLYEENKLTFKDALNNAKLNSNVIDQINYALNDLKPKINKENIKELFNTFTYPLYFLDFESFQEAIPSVEGTKPYQQICFQYSLHYCLEENGELYHKEFLSDNYSNPMYGLCKQLCEDIPLNSCVLVYNKSFEIPRLREMARLFPEFKDHLLNIADNIKDLAIPFQNHDYYVKEMGGSYSIKVVLPALFPNDPSLDYHNLEQVHKGDEASNAYLSLKDLNEEERQILRQNMLKYCGLDTYAMVKIYEKLKEVIKENV